MAPRPKRYQLHISGRIGEEHREVLDGVRDRLEAEKNGERLRDGEVLRWILEQPAVRRLAKLK